MITKPEHAERGENSIKLDDDEDPPHGSKASDGGGLSMRGRELECGCRKCNVRPRIQRVSPRIEATTGAQSVPVECPEIEQARAELGTRSAASPGLCGRDALHEEFIAVTSCRRNVVRFPERGRRFGPGGRAAISPE